MKPFKTFAKYGAKRTNGYASKREAEYANHLTTMKVGGAIIDWLEQVPVKLSVGKYVVDFLVFEKDGGVRLVEVKGMETPVWKLKMLALQNERPELYAKLEVVK